jgi:hypothetical protein
MKELDEEPQFTSGLGVGIVNKGFEVDFDKVKTIEDITVVLRALQFVIHWYQEDCPEQFKEIHEKGFLKQIK